MRPLPPPVVLVAGTFDAEAVASRTAASRTWGLIVREVSQCRCPAAQALAEEPKSRVPKLGQMVRARACHPVPRKLPVAHDADRVQERLYRALTNFDVWAIICCGTAEETNLLLQIVDAVDIPLLVTVASTVDLPRPPSVSGAQSPYTPNHMLRLTSNNDQQAQAIIAKARSLQDAGEGQTVGVVQESESDFYCEDLVNSLTLQTNILGPKVLFDNVGPVSLATRRAEDIIIYVGYPNGLKTVFEGNARCIIVSDGCALSDVDTALRAAQAQNRSQTVFSCLPATSSEQCGLDAFSAISRSWGECVPHHPLLDYGELPSQRLIPFIGRVRSELEKGYANRYKFSGAENLRGGYVIRRV